MSIDLQTRDKVAGLMAEYVHCIDDGRYEDWPGFFTDACSYRITTRENVEAKLPMGVLSCESKGMLLDRINSLRKANIFEPHHYRHLLGPSLLQETPDGAIHARTGFTVFRIMQSGTTELFLTGLYDDIIDTQSASPRLRQRLVILDSSQVDTLIVLPV